MENDGDTKRAKKARDEAQERRKSAGMKPDDRVSEYPEISSLADYLTAVLTMPLTQDQPAAPLVASVPEPQAPKPEGPESETPKPEAIEPAVTKKGQKAVRPLDGGIMPAKIDVPENASPAQATLEPSAAAEPQCGNICGRYFEFFRKDGRLNISGKNGITLAIRLSKKTCTSADLTVTADAKKSKRFTVEEWNLVVDLTHSAAAVLEFVDEQLELRFKLE